MEIEWEKSRRENDLISWWNLPWLRYCVMLLETCIMGYYSLVVWAASKIKKCHARNVTQNSVTHVEWNIVAENYKMASSLVDVASFPPEIISKIAQFLPLQDVLKCMLVCKSWKVSNSNNYGLCEFRSYFKYLIYLCRWLSGPANIYEISLLQTYGQ